MKNQYFLDPRSLFKNRRQNPGLVYLNLSRQIRIFSHPYSHIVFIYIFIDITVRKSSRRNINISLVTIVVVVQITTTRVVDAHRPNRPNNNEKILGVTVVVGEQTRIPTRIRQTIATILVRQEAVVVAVAGTVMMEETKMKMHTDNR